MSNDDYSYPIVKPLKRNITSISTEVFDETSYWSIGGGLPGHSTPEGFWYWAYDKDSDTLYQIHESQVDHSSDAYNNIELAVDQFLG